MDKKRLILMGALAVVGVVVFTQAQKLGQNTSEPIAAPIVEVEQVEYQDILAASADIRFGGRLSSANIKWKQWPKEAMSPEYITREARPEALEEFSSGVARSPIYVGEPISERRVVIAGDRGLMSALLTPGMRAVTTEISTESASGGFIQPGDNVDIILTKEVEEDPLPGQTIGKEVIVSETIFENVRVLAIDQEYDIDEEGGASITGNTATLELNPSDAELLQVAIASGELAMILRPLGSASGTGAATSRAKFSQGSTKRDRLVVYRAGEQSAVAIVDR
jgi:pilus assembly protein CpaB